MRHHRHGEFIRSTLTRRLHRGTFTGIVDLQAAIKRYIAEHNRGPRCFVWTRAAALFYAVNRALEPSDSVSALAGC
jgi:hypothetical protein